MRSLSPDARRYLAFSALLTFGLAISGLFYNLLVVALGYDVRTVRLPVVGPVSILGLLNSTPVLVAGLSSLPIWWLVSRIGPRPALVASALLSAASLLGSALLSEPLPLLAANALGGPASVLFQVSAAPFMMRHSGPRERDALFSLSAGVNIAVGGVGSLAGGLIPGLAVAALGLTPQSADAYRATLVVAAAISALACLPLLVRAPAGHPKDHREAHEDREGLDEIGVPSATSRLNPQEKAPAGLREQLRFLARAALHALPFVVSPLLIGLGAALLIPFLNLYFRQRYGAPDAALGLIFAAIGIATGAATLAAPLLSRRLGKMGSVVLTQALAIPCLLLLGLAPTLWLAATVALVRGSLMNMAAPLYDAYAMERSPEAARPIVIGLINGAFAAGYVIGPTVSAEVQRRAGFGPLFLATAAFYACAALANYLLFVRRGARPLPEPAENAAQRDVLP
jgi:predicted MFS family arabinose efflux permease